MNRTAAARWPSSLPIPGPGDPLAFLRLLWAVAHALESVSKRMKARLGITGPQRLVMRMVGRFPSITAGQLAALLHVHPSTLTGVLQRLVRRGLLKRRADGRDRRRALIGLTAAGRSFDVATEGTIEAAVSETLARASAADVASTRRMLNQLVSRLELSISEPSVKPRSRRTKRQDARSAMTRGLGS